MNQARPSAHRRGNSFRNRGNSNPRRNRRTDRHTSFQPAATPFVPVTPTVPFEELSKDGNVFGALIPDIRKAVWESGYVTPTPVQDQCIPHLLAGRDLMGSAQTGTGKTAAFTLPLLQYLATNPLPPRPRQPRVLILAPTRELAAQISDSIGVYGRHLNIPHAVIYGGVGQRPQEKVLKRGVDILVATPGRLLDLMNQGYVELDAVEAFVLDEADRMLDMGFIHDVRRIVGALPKQRQTLFFSATLAPNIVNLAQSMLKDPVRVTIAPEQPTVDRIEQKMMFVDKNRKDALLISLLGQPAMSKAIVFVQRKHVANQVSKKLQAAGIHVDVIHGNKSQTARMAALDRFRAGRIRALVATDIAARGIDVDNISHVINYELPMEAETYVHRIGRTARAGMNGDAVSFCMASERGQLRAIERFIRKPIPVDRDHAEHSQEAESAGFSRGPSRQRRGNGFNGRNSRPGTRNRNKR